MQVLLYDDNEMHIFNVLDYHTKAQVVDATTIDSMYTRMIVANSTLQAEILIGETKAELDPTTMKRIAKYNLDKDFEELNRKIKEAEGRLKSLEEEVKSKENKLDFMWRICQKIWKDKEFEEENYMPDDEDCEYEY